MTSSKSLAAKVGFTFAIDRRTMYFIKPRDDRKEILSLALGKDIISFSPRMNTTGLVTEVEVRGHNPQDPNTPIVGRARRAASGPWSREGRRQARSLPAIPETVKRVITGCDREFRRTRERRRPVRTEPQKRHLSSKGMSRSIGIPQIRPGVTIKLEKMGQRVQRQILREGDQP